MGAAVAAARVRSAGAAAGVGEAATAGAEAVRAAQGAPALAVKKRLRYLNCPKPLLRCGSTGFGSSGSLLLPRMVKLGAG